MRRLRAGAGALALFGACGYAAALDVKPAAEAQVEFVVVKSDTLISLSRDVLVSPAAWREVAALNRLSNPNRITPGQVLRIPTRLMRATKRQATLISSAGDVRIGDAAATAGQRLDDGQTLQTGAGSSAVLELADGTRVRMPPSSLAQVAARRNYGGRLPANAAATAEEAAAANAQSHWFAGALRVLRGSVEVFATKVLRAKPLEVMTPTAVVGVRGTRYRVGLDADADARTHSEVIEGSTRFDTASRSAGADVATGFGAASAAPFYRGRRWAKGWGTESPRRDLLASRRYNRPAAARRTRPGRACANSTRSSGSARSRSARSAACASAWFCSVHWPPARR